MRVALDVHALQVEGWADRGVGRYVTGYAAALNRSGGLAAALLAPELPPPSGLPNELVAAGRASWDSAATCRELIDGPSGAAPLVYHLTAPFLHTEPGAPASLGVVEHWARAAVPRVALLHDLIPLRAPRHYLHAPGYEDRYRARAEWVATADLVVTNSDYTRREAMDLLGCRPEQVVTVGVGVAPYFSPPDGTDEQLWRFHFPKLEGRPHVVTVGGSDARKGTDRAIVALGLAVGRGLDLSLLVLGHLTPQWREDLACTAAACGVADRVFFGGAVNDELLRACYRRALLTLMPSLAEGAGLPVLESAACGTPALASATTALAETAASPAALFDPTDAGSITDSMVAAVDSAERRSAILAAQAAVASVSTWDAVAARAVAAIRSVVGGATTLGSTAGQWPPRLALVGWPAGEESLLAGIARDWGGEVDVVPAESLGLDPSTAPPGAAVTPIDPAAFGPTCRPASYDQVVYVLSGGPADSWVLQLAGRYAGWLWLWDRPDVPPASVLDRLEPLVRRSNGVLVNSDGARRAVRLAFRPLAAEPPLVVLRSGDGSLGLTAVLGQLRQ